MGIVVNLGGPAIDPDVISRLSTVSVPTIGHYIERGAMDPGIRAVVRPAKFVGRAVTVRIVAPDSALVHKSVALLSRGDVLVVDTGGDRLHAPVGEVVALAAKERGAAAVVIDGPCTDTVELAAIGLPVFSRGTSCLTTKLLGLAQGGINVTVTCGGVVVEPGDVVLGDENGVLVISPEEVAALTDIALADDLEEAKLRASLRSGASLPDATGVTAMLRERFGI